MFLIKNNTIEVNKGNTVRFDFRFFRDSAVPIDISGSTIYFTVKKDLKDETIPIAQTIVTAHTNPMQGLSSISLNTSNIPVDIYYFDILIKYADTVDSENITIPGDRNTIFPYDGNVGTFVVKNGVTII